MTRLDLIGPSPQKGSLKFWWKAFQSPELPGIQARSKRLIAGTGFLHISKTSLDISLVFLQQQHMSLSILPVTVFSSILLDSRLPNDIRVVLQERIMSYVSALLCKIQPRASRIKVNKYFLVHNNYIKYS